MSINYIPPATVEQFMLDPSLVRCIVGPIGSGKSMGCIMELLRRSFQQQPHNGIRYSRFALIRNTLQQLRQTVLSDIIQYLGPMVSYFVTDSTIKIRCPLPDNTTIFSDWMMLPLDTPQDVRRLLSMQLTGAWINECREVPFQIIKPLIGRTGRYPSMANGGFSWRGVIMDSNPWDTDSDYHDALVLNPIKGWKLFKQPSAIGPHAENRQNLAHDYYESLMGGKDTGWQEVHIEGEWGESNAGQAVFRKSFNPKKHVIDMAPNAAPHPHRPLMIGLDFGRTPTALICQVDSFGRLIVFQEICSEDMGLNQMVETLLKPMLFSERFAGRRNFIIADPAGREKGQISEQSPFDALRDDHGFMAYPASTNNIDPRLRAVEKLFLSDIMGEPAIQISREGCPKLIRALGSQYRYKRKKDNSLDEVPDKNHPWSDVADALQYACLGVSANISGRVMQRARRSSRTTHNPMPATGWT